MGKIEVCFFCDKEVLADGSPGELVSIENQLVFFRHKKLVSGTCSRCYLLHHRTFAKNMHAALQAMKKEALGD